MSLVFIFVREEPVTVVVALEAGQETEEFGSEVGRHGCAVILLDEKRLPLGSASPCQEA
jgi:hypothetical protein